MFSTDNILFTLSILKIVSSQQEFQYGVKYRRNEELSNTPPEYKPLQLRLDPKNENVQLPVPYGPRHLKDIANDVQQIPPEEINARQPELSKNDSPADKEDQKSKHASFQNKKAKLSPDSVNYVQEKIAEEWAMGVVPYFIDKDIYDATTMRRIIKTMGIVESSSCVIFKELEMRPKDGNDTWLHITNPTQERECVHEVAPGEAGGIVVVLGFECLHPNEILHTLLHAIGLKDEVSHPHRGQYVRILWENIQPKYRRLFRIQFEDAPYKLVEYDPMSIMHFHDRAFSANGAATIAPVISGLKIGPADTLSPLDIMKLKLAFGHECNKRKIGNLLDTCKNAFSPKKLNEDEAHDTKIHEEDHTNGEKNLHEKEHTPEDVPKLSDEDTPEGNQKLNQESVSEDAQFKGKDDVEILLIEDEKANSAEAENEASIKNLTDEDKRIPNKFGPYGYKTIKA